MFDAVVAMCSWLCVLTEEWGEEVILKCVECDKEIGEARPSGKGRQVELCKECFQENRLRNQRSQDQRKKLRRQSVGEVR